VVGDDNIPAACGQMQSHAFSQSAATASNERNFRFFHGIKFANYTLTLPKNLLKLVASIPK